MADDQEFDPSCDPQVHSADREETMLYRKPTENSDKAAVQEVWGAKLETRVVDAKSEEFGHLLEDGWARSPLELEGLGSVPPGYTPVPKRESGLDAALDAAEKLAQELGEKVKTLTTERDQALAEVAAVNELAEALQTDLSAEKALRESSAEHIAHLEAELKNLRQSTKRAKPTA